MQRTWWIFWCRVMLSLLHFRTCSRSKSLWSASKQSTVSMQVSKLVSNVTRRQKTLLPGVVSNLAQQSMRVLNSHVRSHEDNFLRSIRSVNPAHRTLSLSQPPCSFSVLALAVYSAIRASQQHIATSPSSASAS